jgi:signal transduction histidine kinase
VELQRELLFASERERTAIGQDLHDGLCQHLVGTAFAAQVLVGELAAQGTPEKEAEARRIVRLIEESVLQTRQIARGLLLNSIKPQRLAAELEEFAAAVTQQSRVPCRFAVSGATDTTDEQTASHLFRIAQEAVRNALRHARPKSIEIALTADAEHLTLIVSDDGAGLSVSRPGAGVGLRIMGHRATIIGGDLTVERSDSGGTSVHCRVPARSAIA